MAPKCIICGNPAIDNTTHVDGEGCGVCLVCVSPGRFVSGLRGVLTGTGAAELARRIAIIEARFPNDPEDGKDCDGELEDEKIVVSVNGLPTRPVPVRVPGAPGWFVRLEFYNYLAELWNRWCDKTKKDEREKTERDKFIEAGLEKADEKIDELRGNYHKLRKEAEFMKSELVAAHRKLYVWRNAQRIEIKAIGHKHDGLYARVPEGER